MCTIFNNSEVILLRQVFALDPVTVTSYKTWHICPQVVWTDSHASDLIQVQGW